MQDDHQDMGLTIGTESRSVITQGQDGSGGRGQTERSYTGTPGNPWGLWRGSLSLLG